jgi:hypothetical protein
MKTCKAAIIENNVNEVEKVLNNLILSGKILDYGKIEEYISSIGRSSRKPILKYKLEVIEILEV